MKNEFLRAVQEDYYENGDCTLLRNACSYQSARRYIREEFYYMPYVGTGRVFGSLFIKWNVLLLQFSSCVLVGTGLYCTLSRMVAHVGKKFLTNVRVLSTMYFQISVHLEPISSILKWKQHVPLESLCHPVALHGVQTQKPTIWRNLFRSSLFRCVMQRRLITSFQFVYDLFTVLLSITLDNDQLDAQI
jgi:hypothetical protein